MGVLSTFQTMMYIADIEEDKEYHIKVAYYLNCIFWVLNKEYSGLETLANWKKLFKFLFMRAIRKNCPTPMEVKEIYMPKDCDLVQQTLFFMHAFSSISCHCLSGHHLLNAIKLLMTGYNIHMSNHTSSSLNLYLKNTLFRDAIYPIHTEDKSTEGRLNPSYHRKLKVLSFSFKLDIHFANKEKSCKTAVLEALCKSKGIQKTETRQTQNNVSD